MKAVATSETDSNRRDREADARERALDEREANARIRESDQANRTHEAQKILDDAAQRDDQADARDDVAEKRDMAADLEAFLNTDEQGYAGLSGRLAAALDRSHSKGDRGAAAEDRSQLTQGDPKPDPDKDSVGP
jgi:hypothetical protein